MPKNPHRIVVTLTDGGKKSNVSEGVRQLENDVKIMDERNIMLRIENTSKGKSTPVRRYYRHLEFDAVGYEYETHVRAEICGIMEHLFKKKENCCIIRFAAARTANLNLLTRLLVAEVDKLLLNLHCRLTCIWLEYHDIRKFDMVNLLLSNSSKSKSKNESFSRKLDDNSHRRFLQSTRELFQWLLSDYSVLRSRGMGDDYIDLEFIFVDQEQNKHKLHLSLFQIFGNPEDNRKDLIGFFKSLPEGKRVKPSLLTDCLKESFNMMKPMRTLLLFEVPINKDHSMFLPRMLKLADAAYLNLNLAHKLSETKNDAKSVNSLNDMRSQGKPCILLNSGAIASPPAENPRPSIKMAMKRISTSYSKDDFNSLSYWYNRIDKKINEVNAAMDKYYWALYQNKMHKICSDIRNVSFESGGDMEPEIPNNKDKLEDEELAKQKYNEELSQFRRLDQEVEKSCYSTTLKVYLSTKSYDLVQAEEALKRRELQNLRASVIDFMKTEPLPSVSIE